MATANNKHAGMAEALKRIKACAKAQNTDLDLSGLKLTSLPESFGRLTALTRLSLYGNQLTSLPESFGQLSALTELNLQGNQLISLPESFGQLTALTELSLSRNQLTSLPESFGQLTALTELSLYGNPGLGLPKSALEGRPQDVLTFYFENRKGQLTGTLRPVGYIKVMLVGRGGAGKTSLRRFFLGQPHNPDEQETRGIALDTFEFLTSQETVNVQLWDFAGQEIAHALHKFFLTEGCIYILAVEPRSNTEMQDAEYWLGMLRRYAKGSPVLVALNRQDARQGGYELDRRMLKEQFPAIHSFTQTNCKSRKGCPELKERLTEAIDSLGPNEPPALKVPGLWLRIMEGCAETAECQQHMRLDEFREICIDNEESDPVKQEQLARLLHKLGAVLHFVDEPLLRDTSVLNPHWVTDGVYRLLRCRDIPGSDGVLSIEQALEALNDESENTPVEPEEARFLLRLMERFEMCFPLDAEENHHSPAPAKWLVPGALDQFQPEGVTTGEWSAERAVRLRYLYEDLPEGVIPRFIVRTHVMSEAQPRWRFGVILDDGVARALIRRGATRNHVEVTAIGPGEQRLRMLQIIQGNFERIHADLPDPKPYAEIELANSPGNYRRIGDLQAAEREKQKTVAVQSADGSLVFDPSAELDRTSDHTSRTDHRVPLNAFLSYSHEDRGAKNIFVNNLTVMNQKNLIEPWHDGLIEGGMRWREEIEENLERMDVFVGLLTTAFLASNFIQEVELTAARARLKEKGREFLFLLILVDDISLSGLELAEYQIIMPGGKVVSKHASRRQGFDQAQKEIEAILRGIQSKRRKHDD